MDKQSEENKFDLSGDDSPEKKEFTKMDDSKQSNDQADNVKASNENNVALPNDDEEDGSKDQLMEGLGQVVHDSQKNSTPQVISTEQTHTQNFNTGMGSTIQEDLAGTNQNFNRANDGQEEEQKVRDSNDPVRKDNDEQEDSRDN